MQRSQLPLNPNLEVQVFSADQLVLLSEDYAKCCCVWYINVDRFLQCFGRIDVCDRWTDRILIARPCLHCMLTGKKDGQTEFSLLDHVCIVC